MKLRAPPLAASVGLAACSAMAGFGKDVVRAGEKIQDKAER